MAAGLAGAAGGLLLVDDGNAAPLPAGAGGAAVPWLAAVLLVRLR